MTDKAIPMVGFVAPSGTGKTTLLRKLVPVLRGRGLRVGYLKHTHHDVDVDTPGKDSHAIGEAGAEQVMIASPGGWALMDRRAPAQANLDALVRRFDSDGLDLVLVEGFRDSQYPKIEVHRAGVGEAPLYPTDPAIIAVVTDTGLPGDAHPPILPIDDVEQIADFLCERLAGERREGDRRGDDPRDGLLNHFRNLRRKGWLRAQVLRASVRVGERFWLMPATDSAELGHEHLLSCLLQEATPLQTPPDTTADAPAETATHRAIYLAQTDARAVVHLSSPFAQAVGFAGRDFEPIDHDGMRALGSVPVLTVDTDESSEKAAAQIAESLADFPLCLVSGRGAYARAATLDEALALTDALELSAKIYVIARQASAL
ncbi:MAG: molybdopterin-guanine dinucleotide biosynthesis protein B [Thiohalocapsa sp.]|nr:molybdopterin-guanine dinucleotide biosynthesis protein B [Thiohalocapsa sp.]